MHRESEGNWRFSEKGGRALEYEEGAPMISGQYVQTFAEATHALPEGMHMNANYPFMLPEIVKQDAKNVTLCSDCGYPAQEKTVPIRRRGGREFCFIEQESSFEKIFGRRPLRFKCHPFRDERTAKHKEDKNG